MLDLKAEGGGLQPVRQVGGLQTAGLAMRGADGKSYTFRSLHKEPERLLPAEWRGSWPAKLVRDATSATHPGAAVMLPILAEAAGIPHTRPRLVVMPDDPALGTFRQTFANQLGTFEEYPTAGPAGQAGFAGATEIISTANLWPRWLQGPSNRIDSRAFLRARILDLFVENYDRRRGQWRWMRVPGKSGWQALPEDPDMAFVRHNGLVNAGMRGRQPRLLEFSDKYADNLEGPTSNAAEVDRWLLADVDGPVYDELAKELQAAWSDAVLDRLTADLPEPWRAIDKGALAAALKARRAALPAYVHRFYRLLAERVDLHLTDLDDQVVIATEPDRSTTVTVTAQDGAAYYTRRFRPADTREVRIYLHGGTDRVTRTGSSGPVHVRVIAGAGAKSVESRDARTEISGRTESADRNESRASGSLDQPRAGDRRAVARAAQLRHLDAVAADRVVRPRRGCRGRGRADAYDLRVPERAGGEGTDRARRLVVRGDEREGRLRRALPTIRNPTSRSR